MPQYLWITYAWVDNVEGDFDYLVTALKHEGVTAIYDRIALIPGQRLWEQIATSIGSNDLVAWAFLLTPNSIVSQPCCEELAYALERALSKKGAGFPLIGLIHGVPIEAIPISLRVRLCVNLSSARWAEEIKAAVERRPPIAPPDREGPNFKVKSHQAYCGNPKHKAVEFVARFGEIRYWRIAHPRSGPDAIIKGIGPAGGGPVSGMLDHFVDGATVEIAGIPMHVFGAGDPITPMTAAYAVFDTEFPADIGFGWASTPLDLPANWQLFSLG